MKTPSIRLTFDRYKVATKTHKGNLQIEITYERKRKWISTGIKLFSDQWSDRKHVINSANSIDINEQINEQVTGLEKWIRDNLPFSWEKLDKHLKEGETTDNFIDYVVEAIDKRNDIKDSTKKSQRKLISMLKEYGHIVFFTDLTTANILDFDNWLHGRRIRKLRKDGTEEFVPMKQQSIHDYHKYLHIYLSLAKKRGLIEHDPYDGISIPRGKSEISMYLTEEEYDKLKDAPMRNGSVARARDLFVFQSETGLAYADMKNFDYDKVVKDGDVYVYDWKRTKTSKRFCFILLPDAKRILEKYSYKLPVTTVENYNKLLKKVAEDAGINKPISSHWARRTAGMRFLNAGLSFEIVAKILGHESVKTTESFYAKIERKSVVEAMKKAELK